jgi:outer membrane biosynthesis protein TonB
VTRNKKKLPADTAWPPAGVRDLKPDVPVRDSADRCRFPTLRGALERVPVPIPLATPATTPVPTATRSPNVATPARRVTPVLTPTRTTAPAPKPIAARTTAATPARAPTPATTTTPVATPTKSTHSTPTASLTEQIVRGTLARTRRRNVEYLCRAYLQFGSAAMSDKNMKLLCEAVNALQRDISAEPR